MVKRVFYYIAIFFLLTGILCPAKGSNVNVRVISMDDGLPSNCVRGVIQDKMGYIWFATDNGLCRYDGTAIHSYKLPSVDGDSYISSLCESDGCIIVGTNNGPMRFCYSTENFTPLNKDITNPVSLVNSDREGNIWISAGFEGIIRFTPSNGSVKRYNYKSGEIGCIYVDRDNQVWTMPYGTRGTIMRLNKSTDTFERYNVNLPVSEFFGMRMLHTSTGDMYIGSWENGLYQLDSNGTLVQLLNPALTNVGTHIHDLYEYSPDCILIACDEGLVEYNPQTEKWRLAVGGGSFDVMADDKFVYSVIRDHEGGIWMGTFYGGVNYVSPLGSRFATFRKNDGSGLRGSVVNSFCEDNRHRVWIATDDGGLNCFDNSTGKFIDFPGRSQFSSYNVHAVYVDGNSLWIGAYGSGLTRMDLTTGAQKRYEVGSGISRTSCYNVFRDSQGRLWATSLTDLYYYDKTSDTFRLSQKIGLMAADLEEDSRGNIWVATMGKGIYCLRKGSSKWVQYIHTNRKGSLPSNHVNCIESVDEKLYIATGKGLCEFLPSTGTFRQIILDIPNSNVNGIIPTQNSLWLTTNKGLVRYDFSGKVRVFNRFDGLAGEQFLPNALLLASDGRIFIGTNHGFSAFYPYKLKINEKAPAVVINGLEIYNSPVEVGGDMLPESLGKIDELELSTGDKMVSFLFSSLSYCAPEKNKYSYMLEGFDKNWVSAGTQHRATYTNLSAGVYTFRVRATNNDGVWCSREATLKVVVHPPFYWSLPARIIYLLILVCLIYFFIQHRISNVERKHSLELQLLNTKREKEIHDARLDFFTTIAHEIRTPVSLIIGPLETLKEEWGRISHNLRSSPINSAIDVIDRNSQRLLILVNQLLDFSKVEHKGMQINRKVYNIRQLMDSVLSNFEVSLANRNISFSVAYPEDTFTAETDSEAFFKIFTNLMSNAYKYARSRIQMVFSHADDTHYSITVYDDGMGISEYEREKIFSAFYQGDHYKPGAGIGLSIVKNLVDTLEGRIDVISEVGKGSSFVITLPVKYYDVSADCLAAALSDATLPETTTAADVAEDLPAASSRDTVLIVEDDEDMRNFLSEIFSQEYDVIKAENGAEALRKLSRFQISLVISDWMMPVMDGAEFCRRMRMNKETSHIPFVMLTAKTDEDSKTEGMNTGADIYIEKPFSVKYLEACIHNLLDMRRLLQKKYSSGPLVTISEIATTPVDNDFLERMSHLIEENLSNPDLSVVFLADKLNISRSTLFSKIKMLADVTPNEMIQLIRLKTAARLLSQHKYRISEVCYMVGFNSPSYFSKCFQKQFGMKPQEFIDSGEMFQKQV